METDRLKAEGSKLDGFIGGNSSAWWPKGPADINFIQVLRNTRHSACLTKDVLIVGLITFEYCFESLFLEL